jgi:hypothetical protein
MATKTFETAKLGNKVFSHTFGWGEIEWIAHQAAFPIEVRFNDSGEYKKFTFTGHLYDSVPIQSLFWNYIHIEAPTKPIMVKVINGVEVPDISFKPRLNEYYYTPMPNYPELCHLMMDFYSNRLTNHLSDNNLCYPFTEEGKQAAILHAKAMLGISQ